MKVKSWSLLAILVILSFLGTSPVGCQPAPTAEPAEAPPAEQPPAEQPVAESPATEPPAQPAPQEPSPVTEEVAQEKVLRIGANYMVDTINPLVGWRNWPLRELWYDAPVEWTGMTNVEPGLAESWSTSEDGKVWTFKIREGITFSDGTPCTAEDIAWSLNYVIETKAPTLYTFIYMLEKVEALDDTTLVITTSEPLATMISLVLIYEWILPKHVWENLSVEEAFDRQELDVTIGTGPYKVTEYVKDDHMIMEANPNYWKGKPSIDKIIWMVYPNPDAMLQALMAGEIDLVGTYDPVPATSVETLQQTDGIEVLFGLGFKVNHLVFESYEGGTAPASLDDPIVRRAMAFAVDKEQIVNVAYLGYATPANSVLPPVLADYVNTEMEDISFDPVEGNRILDEAGYLDTDNDGVREYKDGEPLIYRLYGLEGGTSTRILEIISDGLAKIGIQTDVTVMLQDAMQALWPDHDFDLISRSWFIDPDPDFLLSLFTCSSRCISKTECGWSDSGFCSAEYDEMYVKQATLLDYDQRKDLIWQMQDYLNEAKPYIMLFYGQDIWAYNTSLFNFDSEAANWRLKSAITHGVINPLP